MIRGSKDRAEEVKAMLEEWGAKICNWLCSSSDLYYYVQKDGKVSALKVDNDLMSYLNYEVVEPPEKPEKKEEQKHQFKPFDKVLVRDSNEDNWKCGIFSHSSNGIFAYVCVGASWAQCIPFEGNEELIGTTNEPKGGEE